MTDIDTVIATVVPFIVIGAAIGWLFAAFAQKL